LESGHQNYKLAIETGKTIEALSKYLPERLKKSPTTTLYRFVEISLPLFKKVRRNKKQAVLRNRKYSSWSYSLNDVKEFGEDLGVYEPDYVGVILKRTFSDNQILLNIPEYLDFFPNLSKSTEREKEIIVKNASKDFRFTIKDIHEVMNYNAADQEEEDELVGPPQWVSIK
jgi:DUF2075 family protein